ncbi:hypothetical protein FQN60_011369 [Etheostoma spectabile]|uniref:Uncharacterized protein n=1 Tax=Etheostoma spectabile TaxID=54343 RepID=A0A5J5DSF8_9PERO|nr:hypothetical protein FQN60_011369 [Etheostoma spectabile]
MTKICWWKISSCFRWFIESVEHFKAIPTHWGTDVLEQLFEIQLSAVGSNKRGAEECVVAFLRDYPLTVEVRGTLETWGYPGLGCESKCNSTPELLPMTFSGFSS